jgi:hypothetical protein
LGVPGFSFAALACVSSAIAIVATAVAIHVTPRVENLARYAFTPLCAVAIASCFLRLPFTERNPGYPAGNGTFWALATLAAVLASLTLFAPRRSLASAAFHVLLAVHVLMSLTYLRLGRQDVVTDVHVVHNLAVDALLRGRDPYAITFPNIYGPNTSIYPPGVIDGTVVRCGYFYPPVSLLMSLPGHLAGDVRYAHALAIALAAALIAWTPTRAPYRRLARVLAIAVLFTPTVFYQIRAAWTEPFMLLLLAGAAFCASRGWWRTTVAALGLFFVSKQYALLAVPTVWLLWPRGPSRIALTAIACAAAALVTLPFVLWDPRAFLHSNTALYTGMLRTDSISFAPLIARLTGWRPTLLLPAVAAVPPIALTMWRSPGTVSGFAASLALVLLCVFAFSTQSFGNYYLLAGSAALIASATPRPV